jgi:hypothetical protein
MRSAAKDGEMNLSFVIAAALLALLGAAHSYLGERYILIRLFRRQDLPAILGSSDFTKRTLRFAWHITTLLVVGLAAILIVLASPRGTPDHTVEIIAATCAACGLVALAGSRGRHLSWVVFLTVAALLWFGPR